MISYTLNPLNVTMLHCYKVTKAQLDSQFLKNQIVMPLLCYGVAEFRTYKPNRTYGQALGAGYGLEQE